MKQSKTDKKLRKAKQIIEGLKNIKTDVMALKQQSNEEDKAMQTGIQRLSIEKSQLAE